MLEKNPKLSHSTEEEAEFVPYAPNVPARSADSSEFNPEKGTDGESRFKVTDQFWQLVETDPDLKRELNRRIDERCALIAGEKLQAMIPEWQETARAEGYRRGMEQGAEALSATVNRLNEVCDAVMKEKLELIRAHEGSWLQAMNHILDRFLVGNRTRALHDVEIWLQEALSYFEQSGRVRIRLSPGEYDRLKPNTGDSKKSWEWISDSSLPDGQIHVECGDGGFLFSEQEERKRLDALVERHIQSVGRRSA